MTYVAARCRLIAEALAIGIAGRALVTAFVNRRWRIARVVERLSNDPAMRSVMPDAHQMLPFANVARVSGPPLEVHFVKPRKMPRPRVCTGLPRRATSSDCHLWRSLIYASDGLSKLTAQRYLAVRVADQLRYYQARVRRLDMRRLVLQAVALRQGGRNSARRIRPRDLDRSHSCCLFRGARSGRMPAARQHDQRIQQIGGAACRPGAAMGSPSVT